MKYEQLSASYFLFLYPPLKMNTGCNITVHRLTLPNYKSLDESAIKNWHFIGCFTIAAGRIKGTYDQKLF
ncbi:hypothetical protein A4R26_09475 [Niastella populi]|uniref:Uncharacterized protein n=1 Tax=Niastella populi TaxID=550983 RepID=A0A1V9EIK2_9BACT|nr:hypothetical protein A4R26_09475 [Niastella populi]